MTVTLTQSSLSVNHVPGLTRTIPAICAVFALVFSTNITIAADAKVTANQILEKAIPTIHQQMTSMSQGCSGGSNGVPPVSWGALQGHGNTAIDAFSNARIELTKEIASGSDQTDPAKQQINSGLGEYDAMINGLHNSCSGGCCGTDPVSYGAYVQFRNDLKTRLQTAMEFF
jgi:hypothetical protein